MGYGRSARWNCPNCGERRVRSEQRKHLITQLLRCGGCQLFFRGPTDPPDFGTEFYQGAYQQDFTTDCPSDAELQSMLDRAFHGTPKDFSDRIRLLRELGGAPGTVLDFGASWGYGTWQFCRAGFQAVGFEPSRSRARYAQEKLSMRVVHDDADLDTLAKAAPFDAVFSSHVLEHVPRPTEVIDKSKTWLRSGGFFVAFTPNGSSEYRAKDPRGYRNHWGMAHPNYLDVAFYQQAFRDWKTFITGTPVDDERLATWDRVTNITDRLDSWELLVIAKRP